MRTLKPKKKQNCFLVLALHAPEKASIADDVII